MNVSSQLVVNVLSTGHPALDHRLFDKQARALVEAGARVRIFADNLEREVRDGVEIFPLNQGCGRFARFAIAPWRALWATMRQPAAIVHIHDLELLQICPLLKLFGQPVIVYDAHEDFATLILSREWIPRSLRPVVRRTVRLAQRLLAASVDGVVAVTPTVAERFPHTQKVVLPNLPSRSFVSRALQDARPPSERSADVIHLGTLDTQDRLEFLRAVFEHLLARRPATTIRVVGIRPDQVAWLRRRCDASVVDVLGKVPYEEVPALLRQSKVGLNVRYREEALPVRVLEYMACGCGVVTSSFPALDRLLTAETKPHLTMLGKADAADFAQSIAQWLDDPVLLDAAARRLQEAVLARFTWDSQAERLELFYRDLLAESQRN